MSFSAPSGIKNQFFANNLKQLVAGSSENSTRVSNK
jgi:hypothetical protein